jgi:hypothetical protein
MIHQGLGLFFAECAVTLNVCIFMVADRSFAARSEGQKKSDRNNQRSEARAWGVDHQMAEYARRAI